MAQIVNPAYPTVGGDTDQWGPKALGLWKQLVDQGNASDATLAVLAETIRDVIGATLQSGDRVTIGVDDAGDKITISAALITVAQLDPLIAALIRDSTSATRAALVATGSGASGAGAAYVDNGDGTGALTGELATYILTTEDGTYLTTEGSDYLVAA